MQEWGALVRLPRPSTGGALPRAYWWLWLTNLVIWSSRLVFPFLMTFLTRYEGWSVSAASLGLAAYGIGGVAAVLATGTIVDRIGPRLTLVAALLGSATVTVLLGLAQRPEVVAVTLALLGAFLNSIDPPVNAMLSTLVSRRSRVQAFAVNYVGLNLGFAIAPVIAGLLAGWHFRAIFPAQALGFVMAAALAAASLRTTEQVQNASSARRRGGRGGPWSDPVFVAFLAANLAFQVVYVQSIVTLPVVMHRQGMTTTAYAALLTLNGVLVLVFQLPAMTLVSRLPRAWAVAGASVVTAAGFASLMFAHTWSAYAVCVVLWTMGELVNMPVTAAIAADLAPAGKSGSYLAGFSATWLIALLIGPVLGGVALDRLGPGAVWLGCGALGLASAASRAWTAPRLEHRLMKFRSDPQTVRASPAPAT